MRAGEIWICSDHCCFGIERDFPHYARIISVNNDSVEYSLIDKENGEAMLMVVVLEDGKVGSDYSEFMDREEFVYYYNKLRDTF